MNKLKSAIAAGALLASAGGVLLGGVTNATAQGTPTPWAPNGVSQDPNAIGGLAFFDAAGNQITSGSSNSGPFAAYTVGFAEPRSGNTIAFTSIFTPQVGVTPDQWLGSALTGSTVYPNTAAPAPVNGTTLPVNTGTPSDSSLESISNTQTTASDPAYKDIFEIRLYTNKPRQVLPQTYDYADVRIDQSTHKWTLVYSPDQAGTATASTLTASPTTVVAGSGTVHLTDTITTAGAKGSVQFKDGSSNVGSPVAVSGGTAETDYTPTTAGPHPITAVFTPTALSGFAASTSNGVTVTATAPATPTSSTALAVNPTSGPAYSDVTLTATVTPNSAGGTVEFLDNGAQIGSAPVSAGSATIHYSGFAPGDHPSLTASFVPTDSSALTGSTSPAADFNAGAAVGDVQNLDADVNPGALSITTPYTPSNVLHVGALTLNADGTELTGSTTFGDGTTQGGSIKVVDTRTGGVNWTASARSSDLSDGSGHAINQQNVGLTGLAGLYTPGNALQNGKITFTNNPAAEPAVASGAVGTKGLGGVAHAFAASNAGGAGTVGIYGTLTINAPTSTVAGHYTGTVTFTVA